MSMYTPLLVGLTLVLLALLALWARARVRRIRAAATQREQQALRHLQSTEDSDTMFDATGLPSRLPAQRGIEVAEHDDVVDLEALLAGEDQGVARRARATLEEPTNILLDGGDTLPPALGRPASLPLPVAPPAPPPQPASSAKAVPVPAPRPAPAAPASIAPAPIAAAPRPPATAGTVSGAAPLPPMLVAAAAPPASQPAAAPQTVRRPAPLDGGMPIRSGDDVSLRELALAWFEARGYRSAPASAAVRPIEQVLRHRHDPARAYAFVVENARVTSERVQQLRTQARAIGLLRVLIVANAGADDSAATRSKGVRLMDRASLAAEFDQLDFSVAAKIYAVARKRSSAVALS